jgi:hypothetical protein
LYPQQMSRVVKRALPLSCSKIVSICGRGYTSGIVHSVTTQ